MHGALPRDPTDKPGQMDRWSLVVTLNYLKNEVEEEIIIANCPEYGSDDGRKDIKKMVLVADLRKAFIGVIYRQCLLEQL